jgi:aspartyl-tRNA(Asn)/glutamyl-tRNA(Gln) amidotransferase subunit A
MADGEFGSALAHTRACLERIRRHDGAINAFITVLEEEALEAAAAADAAAAEGRWLGLLHGMPVAIKDNIQMAGVRTTSGAAFMADFVPDEDAEVVRRLRGAGAVILGKATMQELAFGGRNQSPVTGQSFNPWALDRVPGGSSGGSAAALAAEMCLGALGTDTGGSVRGPAATCGCVGLRPTHGRIPLGGITPVSLQNDTVGPMARRVTDVARMFAALTGYDRTDSTSVDRPLENFLPTLGQGVEGVRIGIPRNHYFTDLDPEVEAAVRGVGTTFRALGAELREVEMAGAETMHGFAVNIVYADAALRFREQLTQSPSPISEPVRIRMSRGLELTALDYAVALEARREWRRTLANLFEAVDILLVPTSPVPAQPVEDRRDLHRATGEATRFTYPSAAAGIPSLSVPCGFTAAGLPVGCMLEAAWWREPLLLRAGHAYQGATEWHLARPPMLEEG